MCSYVLVIINLGWGEHKKIRSEIRTPIANLKIIEIGVFI